jgi:hypothetical protein
MSTPSSFLCEKKNNNFGGFEVSKKLIEIQVSFFLIHKCFLGFIFLLNCVLDCYCESRCHTNLMMRDKDEKCLLFFDRDGVSTCTHGFKLSSQCFINPFLNGFFLCFLSYCLLSCCAFASQLELRVMSSVPLWQQQKRKYHQPTVPSYFFCNLGKKIKKYERGTNVLLVTCEDWIISFKAGTDLFVIPLLP